MTRRRPAVLAAAVALMAGAAIAIALSPASAATGGTPLPTHVFAPYFEAWTGGSPATLAQQSGARYLTMAFLQAATKGSCVAYWNGDTGSPISSTTFGADFQTIRAGGGDVIPSFGGFTADDTGTEIADSCTNVASIASVFENVVTTYNVTRIDLDVEDNSLTNTAASTAATRRSSRSRIGPPGRAAPSSSRTRCRPRSTGWPTAGWRCCAAPYATAHASTSSTS